ncbi:MAG: hypothetical protein H7175_18050 [Burkholderiales bacterium]|nr:hypothetical protein [Anaerolineae bacterium]
MATRTRARRQLRGFVLIWTAITLIMGACTFVAIYMAYGAIATGSDTGSLSNVALALPDAAASTSTPASSQQVAAQVTTAAEITATVIPTRNLPSRTPTTEATLTTEFQMQAVVEPTETEPPPPTATQLPVDHRVFEVGIQVQESVDGNQELWMGEVDKLETHWIKHQVRWELMEVEEDQIDWTVLDIVLPTAHEHGIKVMLSIVTAPDWAREPGVDTSRHGPPADNQDYADFVTAIIERYPGMVHAVEVWNEQNLDREWTSARGLSAANYVALLRTTYQAIKEIDPGIIVISGALSPTGLSDGVRAWDDFTYLEQLIEAGMLNYADCVGAHHNGYNVPPSMTWDNVPNDPTARFRGPFDNPHHSWSFRSTLQTYAFKIEQAGGDQKLCVTEFGWPSIEDMAGMPAGFEFAADNTLEEQRDWTIEAINNMQEWDIVWLAFLWNLNYGPQAGWASDNDNVPYSIIGRDWNFRPIYGAFGDWQDEYYDTLAAQGL